MILFLGKNYNDLDRIVPLIDYMSKISEEEIVLCLGHSAYKANNDFRISYLRRTHNLKIIDFYRDPPLGYLKVVLKDFGTRWSYWTPNRRFQDNIYSGVKSLFGVEVMHKLIRAMRVGCQRLDEWFYGFDYAKKYLTRLNPSVIVSDDRPRPRSIFKAAHNLGIPVIGVPHGVNIAEIVQSDYLVSSDSLDDSDFTSTHTFYSKLLTTNENAKKRYKILGVPSDKIIVAGSPRFCPQWREIYSSILPFPKGNLPVPQPDRVKLVIMDQKSTSDMDVEEIYKAVRGIQALGFVDLVVKPSTGNANISGSLGKNYHATEGIGELCQIETEEHSCHLIAWADAVIATRSSISLEVLLQGKTLIHPLYFGTGKNILERYQALWMVENFEEMIKALEILRITPDYRPYSDSAVEAAINHIVLGDNPKRNVLDTYTCHITSLRNKLAR